MLTAWCSFCESSPAQDEDQLAAAAPRQTLPGLGLAIAGDLETATRALEAPWPGHGFRAWGWGSVSRSFVGLSHIWIEPYFVGPAGLPVKSTAEPFQLPAQLSVGHAATVKLPLPVLLVGIAVNAPETVLLLPPQRPFGGVETGSSMARWRLSGMLLCCVASAAGLPGWWPTRGLARKSIAGIPRRAGTSETGMEELLSPEPL